MGEFGAAWTQFTGGLGQLADTAHVDLDGAWQLLRTILLEQGAAADQVISALDALTPAQYEVFRDDASRAVLVDALDSWERLRPLKRAERVVEGLFRGMHDLARRQGAAIAATGPDVAEALGGSTGPPLARYLVHRRTDPEPMPLQAVAARAIAAGEEAQLRAAGEVLAAMGRGTQEIRRRWEDVRLRIDAVIATPRTAHPVSPPDASQVASELDAAVARGIDALRRELGSVTNDAAVQLVRAAAWHRTPHPPVPSDGRASHFEHWAVQIGALEDELRFERAEDQVERALLAVGARAASALEAERAALVAGNAEFVAWLDERAHGEMHRDAPRAAPPIVPALRRSADLMSTAHQVVAQLPDRIQLLRRIEAVPVRVATRKAIEPERIATVSFERVGRAGFDAIFAAVQAEHVGLVQQFERARQVVEFAAEGDGSAGDASVERDAFENARTLLEIDPVATPLVLTTERGIIARTLADTFVENRLLLSRSRFGAIAHIGQLGARQGINAGVTTAVAGAAHAIRSAGRAMAAGWRRFLVAIEWLPATGDHAPDVIRRPYLPVEFTRDPRERDLPAIYRRLFRFDAVDDPRFLVGREREMHALSEARALWESGRPVALLVVGDRGSGKTSLINCAVAGPLSGLPVVRGEFHDRLTTARDVRAFVAALCETTPEELEAVLHAEQRVVILEETERSYLREMGGFEGVRELQRLIAATGTRTLWLLVTNQHAFRFLDATVKFGAGFSHRLDAASATPVSVREAILVRHHLSGLRLRFLPPPPRGSLLARARRRIAGDGDPETLFFEALSRESAGVFRTAFELWLGQIDSVQAGTMIMKPITAPDIDAVIEQLDADDLFTLVAIMQHGSLTPEEHAAVFKWTVAASRAELDDLLAREIIESEPGRPGFRVRPGALRVAREALHRRNLG